MYEPVFAGFAGFAFHPGFSWRSALALRKGVPQG
jgi:hypothetical protein